MKKRIHIHNGAICALILMVLFLPAGCGSPAETAVGVGAATAFAGHYPANEIEQIYYLGVFDPQEQVPPTVYRVRVRGQASAISLMRFSSGWVKADLIDSLGSQITQDPNHGAFQVTKDSELMSSLPTGRKLVLFGPEGFREAPRDHRLVIVMGASPEKFFAAMDQSLGTVAQAGVQLKNEELNGQLLRELLRLRDQEDRVNTACAALSTEAADGKGGE